MALKNRKGMVTYAYSDWNVNHFANGIMKIRGGKHTDVPIHRSLKENENEGIDYYVKPDPNFKDATYDVCHPEIRERINVGEFLFFRTLWRESPYFFGYFHIGEKIDGEKGPILKADMWGRFPYTMPISEETVLNLNPKAKDSHARSFNEWVNYNLGYRRYLELDEQRTDYLLNVMK